MSSRRRKLLVIVAAVVALLGLGWWAGSAALTRFLEGQKLKSIAARKTGKELGGDCGYLPLSWRGLSVYSEGLRVEAAPERSLHELRVRDLSARCNPFELWRGEFHIGRLTAGELEAAFGEAAARKLQIKFREPPPLEPPSTEESRLKVEIREVEIARTRLFWGDRSAGGAFRDVATRFQLDGKNLIVHGRDGSFEQSGWPEARVRDFKLYYAKPQLRVNEGTLLVGKTGTLQVQGEFNFGGDAQMDLQLRFADCPVAPFLKPAMREKFSASFASNTRLQKKFGETGGAARAEGHVSFAGAVLRNVEGLEKIAAFTGRRDFARLKLKELRGQYRWESPRLKVEDFELEAAGLVRASGTFTVRDGAIDGTFELGTTAAVLESFPGAREEVFQRRRGDYFYTTVKLDGPLKKPRNDLKPRLVAAAKKHFAKKLLAPILKPGEEIVELLEKLF